jgi:zinc protease
MNEDFRKYAPEPLEAIPFNVPKPFRTTLSNGLRIVIVEDKRHPLINFRLAFPRGDIYDPADGVGVTSALASMLNEGTETHTSKELAEEIERLGASLSVGAGLDNTVVKANTLSLYRTEILRLVAEMVLTPTFPEEELELYKQNAIEGLKYQRSQPDFLADEQVARIIYGAHPYGINSPSEDDFKKLDREQLVRQHAGLFIPNNAIFIIVGDVDGESLVKEIEENFGGWQKGEIDHPTFADPPVRERRTLTIVDRPGSTQANIVLSNPAIERNHPEYFPLILMNQILGAGASSRLFMNLREEKGYTYGAYSRIYAKRLAGSFEASSEVRTAVTGDSLKEFFFELNRIRDEKASAGELQDAKNYLRGVFPIRAETQSGLTNLIVSQYLYDLPEDYLETYRDRINAVTLEDVERVANEFILPEKLALVIVGDAEEILPQTKIYTEDVEVFDNMGNEKGAANYAPENNSETVDANGNWKLLLDAMGRKYEFDLILRQDGENLSGQLDSAFGSGEIKEGSVSGAKISITAGTEFQGQMFEFGLKGQIEGDSIEGTISAPMIPMPLEFKGNRI